MSSGARRSALIDTSVLLNFLAIDRTDLLACHPELSFVVTDHVRGEVTDRRPGQVSRFELAMRRTDLVQTEVSDPREVEIFVQLQRTNQLGMGESAAAAAAIVRKMPLATDDRRARAILGRLFEALEVLGTADIMRSLISVGVLTVAEADAIKAEWETKHRFRLPFNSFASAA